MNYKGAYSAGEAYSVGDVVVYTDGIPYFLQSPASAGTTCHDTNYWQPLNEELRDVVVLFHSMFTTIQGTLAQTTSVVNEMLFDEKTIILKSSTESSDKVYAITVDDSDGLEATEIEEEGGDT